MSCSGIKLGVSICIAGFCTLVATAQGGTWRTDFEQARADAQRQQLPLLIHFYAEWCSPCRRMDREVLHAPQLTRLLNRKLIAVKVDSDRNPHLVKKYAVRVLPSDVIIDPQGRQLQQSTGYLSPAAYLAKLNRVVKTTPAASPTQSAAVAQTTDNKPTANKPTNRRLTDNSAEQQQSASTSVVARNAANGTRPNGAATDTKVTRNLAPLEQVPIQRPEPMIGLDAYSPVSLWKWRKWRKGTPEFQVTFQQVTYYLADEEERRLFQSDPRKYAPRLTGCDPVIMTETDQAIAGDTQYGAFFDSGLYLFASRESRDQFKKSPLRYTRIQHARRQQDRSGTRIR